MAVDWTVAQRLAIRATGRSLLVSAAAGSGKTAVLAERCAHLVCDAADPCGIDELLVVTFTEAAAAEMRGRIQAALAARLESTNEASPWLRRQLALVEHAHIGTIHGFCARLLRQNFSLAGIDPRFCVIDADEAALLRGEVARELFDERYERDSSGRFRAFVDAHGDGRDERLIDQVCRAHELLCSLAQPGKWLRNSMNRLAQAGEQPLDGSELGRELLARVQTSLVRLQKRRDAARATLQSLGGFSGYVTRLGEWSSLIGQWQDVFSKQGFDALAKEWGAFDPPRAPSVKNEVPNKDRAKGLYDSIRKQMCGGELAELLAFTESRWQEGQRAIVPMAEVFISLVSDFSIRYTEAKARMRGVDFSDLERKTLDLLWDKQGDKQGNKRGGDHAPSRVAQACHVRYKHVLVDEYQDVNQIQDAILCLVSAECVAAKGAFSANLFTVGDVKQSVYRFRLAEPDRFLERGRRFRADPKGIGQVIDLQENFRSRPALLAAVNQVFSRLMTKEAAEIEYDQTHHLRPPAGSETEASKEAPIELHLLPRIKEGAEEDGAAESEMDRTEYEATLCAKRIVELVSSNEAQYGEIAILLRSAKHKADDFAGVLRRHDIPVHNTGGSGFFEATEIRDVMALLNILDNQQQDVPLAAFLRSPLSRLAASEAAMARIVLAFRNEPAPTPFHQAVARYAAEKQDDLSVELTALLARLSLWRDLARQRPLAELIWRIFDETAYLSYAAGLEDGPQRVANLIYLHQRARQFGSFLKQGLNRFMAFLGKLREETDLSQPSIASEAENAVRIMTIHRSKGLEFPVVFVPDLGKRHNLSDAHGSILLDRRSGLGLSVVEVARRIRYPSLSSMLTSAGLKRQSLAEELRLLYVAMTRAKSRLILIGTEDEKESAKWAAEYGGYQGPLATDVFLSAGSMLDWLGPVQAACGEETIKLTTYSAEDLAGWEKEGQGRKETTDRMRDLAAMKPLDPAPPANDRAAGIIGRLEFRYPHEQATRLRAAQAASAVGEHPAPAVSALEDLGVDEGRRSADLSAAQIGEATHLVLEHLDYRRKCDLADIQAQIGGLVGRRLLADSQAAAVDALAIAWLAGSELGTLLKANAGRLMREVPFAVARETISEDPLDAVMIRGRIDLIVPTENGIAVVDYKTDRVGGKMIDPRAQEYQGQIEIYRDALERIAKKRVTDIYLVFLHPRFIWRSPSVPVHRLA